MQLCPTRHQLEACQLVARLLEADRETPTQDLRSSFWNVPTGGRFSIAHLEFAANLLSRIGLVAEDGEHLWPSAGLHDFCKLSLDDAARLVLVELLARERPLWLRAAMLNGGGFAYETVPDETLKRIEGLIQDQVQRDAVLLQAGYRVDIERRSEIGRIGELAVIESIKLEYARHDAESLSSSIHHVSEASDALGYDVSCLTLDGARTRRLEIKTSASSRPIRVFLSRNEFDRGLSDQDWRLVVCVLDEKDARVVGWTKPMWIAARLPNDSGSTGCRWESSSLVFDRSDLSMGLPLI